MTTKQLQWLGDCLEQKVDIITLFGIEPQNYDLIGEKAVEQESQLMRDLRDGYKSLSQKITSPSIDHLPLALQTQGKELVTKITNLFELLMDAKNYKSPDTSKLGYNGREKVDLRIYLRTLQNNTTSSIHAKRHNLIKETSLKKDLEQFLLVCDAFETIYSKEKEYEIKITQYETKIKSLSAEIEQLNTTVSKITSTAHTLLKEKLKREGKVSLPDGTTLEQALELIKQHRQNKEYDTSLKICHTILRIDDTNPHAHYFAATIYETLQNWSDAKTHYLAAGCGSSAKAGVIRIEEKLKTTP